MYVYVYEQKFVGGWDADNVVKHTTETMPLFARIYLCHPNPNPFFYQCLMSTYTST